MSGTHPRLAVSEMCTYPWPLTDELALWDELGVRRVGLINVKVDAYGRDKAIAAFRDRGLALRRELLLPGLRDGGNVSRRRIAGDGRRVGRLLR